MSKIVKSDRSPHRHKYATRSLSWACRVKARSGDGCLWATVVVNASSKGGGRLFVSCRLVHVGCSMAQATSRGCVHRDATGTNHFAVQAHCLAHSSGEEQVTVGRACPPRPFCEPLADVLEQKVRVEGWQFGVEMVQGPRGPVSRAYMQQVLQCICGLSEHLPIEVVSNCCSLYSSL